MIINKRSWHYWLYSHSKSYYEDDTTNLCDYVQTIARSFIVWGLRAIIVSTMLGGMGLIVFLFSRETIRIMRWYTLLIPVVIALNVWFIRWRTKHVDAPKTGPSVWTIIGEYLRAKKVRFCPKISYSE